MRTTSVSYLQNFRFLCGYLLIFLWTILSQRQRNIYLYPLFSSNYFFFFLHQDTQKAKQFLPFLQRAGRSEAVVEYVFSGSRLKLYLPKETCLITFLLAGECVPQVTPSVLPWSLKPSCFSSIPPNTGLWRIVGKTAQKLTLLRWKE